MQLDSSDFRQEKLSSSDQATTVGRRGFLKRAAVLGLSVPSFSLILAACGDEDEPTGNTTPTLTPTTESDTTSPPATATATDEEVETEEPDEPVIGGGIINLPIQTGDSGIGNPILASATQGIGWYVFDRLMTYDDIGDLVPDLATSWEFSPDNLELTLNLAEATWHDGEPFDADDVIFTFDSILDDATETPLRSRLEVADETITWESPDPRTVVLTMPTAFAPLLYNINEIPMIPRHLLEDSADINTDPFNKQPIGTGPFRLTEWVPDQFMKMERFDDYFQGPALADGITYLFLADSLSARAALESGEVDMIGLAPEDQAAFKDHEDFNLHRFVYFTPITLAFNHKHPILQDLTVRKAIEMAIDKASLSDTVTRGLGIVAHNQFADSGPLDRYNDYDNVTPPELNIDEANRMLDEAGYTAGSDGIRVSPDGMPLSFPILTYSGFDEYANGQIVLQDMLIQIGIDLIPTVVEYATLESMWADPDDDPLGRAMELQEWPHPFEFDPDLYNELHSGNHSPGDNYMWFADDEVDDLIERGRTETDPATRVEIYRQLDVRRAEVLPAIPLYLAADAWVASTNVLGDDGEPISSPYFRRAVQTAARHWWKPS